MKDRLKQDVEWQGVSTYTTKQGKEKEILTGIPLSGFWRLWASHKDELKAMGLTVNSGKSTKTGEFYVRDGIQHEKLRKQWEVIIWISNRNQTLVDTLLESEWQDSPVRAISELVPF